MTPDVYVTAKKNLIVKKELAFVSVTKTTNRAEAIAALKAAAVEMGAIAIFGLCVSEAFLDPHFGNIEIHAHGKAAIV